jgi:bifunctional DNA-binding transcriptional regulator/antitoxin component of YhaV-PrlF toxin-antitoxin module
MRRLLAHLSSKGQRTLPSDARKALAVEPGQSVMVELHDDGRVTLAKPLYTVETLNGILPALDPPPSADFEQEIHDAQLDMADRALGTLAER